MTPKFNLVLNNLWVIHLIYEKLYFTTLNYTSDYTLHPKLFEFTLYILNYDPCYTLHPNVNFIIKLDKN